MKTPISHVSHTQRQHKMSVPRHGGQVGSDGAKTGGDRVKFHLLYRVGLRTLHQVVGAEQAEADRLEHVIFF